MINLDLFLVSRAKGKKILKSVLTLQFFAQAGFPCPALRNTSDHFLRCINSDFDNRSVISPLRTVMPVAPKNLDLFRVSSHMIGRLLAP